jgi:hypothetical protein
MRMGATTVLCFLFFVMVAKLFIVWYVIVDVKYGFNTDPCFKKTFFVFTYSYLSWKFKIIIVAVYTSYC